MNLTEFKEFAQKHFSDGLVTIVGSGLSAAEGLPTMAMLGNYLLDKAKNLNGSLKTAWEAIEPEIRAGKDLENILKNNNPDEGLFQWIVGESAEYILREESKVFSEVISGRRQLRFSQLLSYLIFNNQRHTVITTNYDRLLELASERLGYGVNSFFVGYHRGFFDPKVSQHSMCCQISEASKSGIKLTYRKHVVLIKPHGSIDWFYSENAPIRCALPIDSPRLMIAPGAEKYRKGYDIPFDFHISEANKAIDSAARYLIIGYGFNDDHLETHLRQELKKGKPCLILTKELTQSGKEVIKTYPQIVAVSEFKSEGKIGTRVNHNKNEHIYPDVSIWDLNLFLKEVFNA